MRYLLAGLGNIGGKRKAILGERCVATADPFNTAADYKAVSDVPLDRYDAAILAVPNPVKIELLDFLLERGKHALVEKPLILDEAAAARLGALSARTQAVWYTSYNFRFEPNVVALKRHLDAGTIGRLYRVHMFYGNGTAQNIADTWRDSRLGVLEDMASHLIDLAGFVFGRFGSRFDVLKRRAYELKHADHCVLATPDRDLFIEVSFVSWKNRWRIDAIGERGALEMDGLTKWGPSELVVRTRTFPSGLPDERRDVVDGPDPTWAADIAHFETLAAQGRTSRDNDMWLSRTILAAAEAATT